MVINSNHFNIENMQLTIINFLSAYIASALHWVPCLKKIRSTAIDSTLPCQQERFNAHNSCTLLNHNFKMTLQLVTFEKHVWQMSGNTLCLPTFCCLFLVPFIGWKLLIATCCHLHVMVALVSTNFINNFNLLWWHRFSQCFAWIWQNYITVFLFVKLEQSTSLLVNAYHKHFNCKAFSNGNQFMKFAKIEPTAVHENRRVSCSQLSCTYSSM